MKEKIKELWLEALRSGDYKQSIHKLYKHEEDGYCCLGVLCEIHRKQTRSSKNYWTENGELYIAGNTKSGLSLPKNVAKWADINYAQESKLANLNDHGKSFKYIASIIKKQL